MKTLNVLASLFFGVVLAGAARAQLGETPQGCVKRYGEPWKVGKEPDRMHFKNLGYRIMAQFRGGLCEVLVFVKEASDAQGRALEISEAEVRTLMDSSSGGARWKELASLNGNKSWKTDDDKVLANYSGEHFFTIMTRRAAKDTPVVTKNVSVEFEGKVRKVAIAAELGEMCMAYLLTSSTREPHVVITVNGRPEVYLDEFGNGREIHVLVNRSTSLLSHVWHENGQDFIGFFQYSYKDEHGKKVVVVYDAQGKEMERVSQ